MANGKLISVFHAESRHLRAAHEAGLGAVEQALAREVTRLNTELAAARVDVEQLKRERGTPNPNA
jgi:hypothetical protein